MPQTFKSNLLKEAQSVFTRLGVSRLSEPELIEALHVAPATFYGMFKDKEDLVFQAMQYDLERQKQEHAQLFANFSSPVERMMALHAHGFHEMNKVTSISFLEVQHLYPRAWKLLLDHLATYSYPQLRDLIQDGVLQQQFRHDIDIELVTKIIMQQMNMVFNHELFPPDQYSRADVFRGVYFYYLRGLCTTEGLRLGAEHFSRL
jgi:AcrR family transcriptional regulator